MGSSTAYVQATSELRQGDIVEGVPWGLIDAPVTICRPESGQGQTSLARAQYGPSSEIRGAFKGGKKERVHATAALGRVVVLWHGCQLDKFSKQGKGERAFAGVAPVLPLADLPREHRAGIEAGRHFSFFPLPGAELEGHVLEPSYVDLRHVWSVKQQLLRNNRHMTTGAELLKALFEHLFTFFTRFRFVEAVACPACSITIPTASFLQPTEESD